MPQDDNRADRAVRGTICRRLLVNALVDPSEAAARLPPGLRPHVTSGGTVVGCCLLEIGALRPAGVPAALGRTLRAAAHRISVEWDDGVGDTVTGVYVPVRHTDSPLAALLGGRWFPGVHRRARVEIAGAGGRLSWVSLPRDQEDSLGMRVEVSLPAGASPTAAHGPVGATCLGAAVGVSPDHRGLLEGARMDPEHHDACAVSIESLDSSFLASFATATPAPSYLMRDAAVLWTPASLPDGLRTSSASASASASVA